MMTRFIKFILLISCFTLIIQSSQAQDFKITKGTILKYKYVRGKSFYRLYIIIKDISPDINLDWILLGYNSSSGSITIKKNAADCALQFDDDFESDDTTFVSTTCIRMSNSVYTGLKKSGAAKLIPDKSENTFQKKNGKNYDISLNGKNIKVSTIYAESINDWKDKIWIYDNKDFPLVLAMNMGVSLELYEVNTCPDCSSDNKVKGKELESIIGKKWNDPDIFSLIFSGTNPCPLEPGYENMAETKWGRTTNHEWTSLDYKCFEKGVHLVI